MFYILITLLHDDLFSSLPPPPPPTPVLTHPYPHSYYPSNMLPNHPHPVCMFFSPSHACQKVSLTNPTLFQQVLTHLPTPVRTFLSPTPTLPACFSYPHPPCQHVSLTHTHPASMFLLPTLPPPARFLTHPHPACKLLLQPPPQPPTPPLLASSSHPPHPCHQVSLTYPTPATKFLSPTPPCQKVPLTHPTPVRKFLSPTPPLPPSSSHPPHPC